MDDRDKFGRSYLFAFVLIITILAVIIGIPVLIYALYKASKILGAVAFVAALIVLFDILRKIEPWGSFFLARRSKNNFYGL